MSSHPAAQKREAEVQHIIPFIRETVRADAQNGKVVDVDAYCERFAAMRQDLSRKDIQDVVLEAVASVGGNAAWTDGRSKMEPPVT
jgi:hypothetical protein